MLTLIPEAITVANRKANAPPSTQLGMLSTQPPNFAKTPMTRVQKAQAHPAWRR